jgi:hypothetical protein
MLLLDFHLSIYRLRIFMCLTIDVGFSRVSLWKPHHYCFPKNYFHWFYGNFHGQASDAYAYVWMVQGSLFSWITLWNLYILSLWLDKWKSNNFIMGYYDNNCLIIEICVKRLKKKRGGLLCEMLLLDFHLSIYRLHNKICFRQ